MSTFMGITECSVKSGMETSIKLAEIDMAAAKRKRDILGSKTEVTVTGTKYYVSVDGDDANSGKTPETPWKTIKRMSAEKLSAGDGVFFKRGDTFREEFVPTDGVTYSAYGDGDKPKLLGSKENSAGAENWQATKVPNVWVFIKEIPDDVGNIVFNDGKGFATKYFVMDRNERTLDKLTENLMFLHGTDNRVYLRCDHGNPGEVFHSIEMARYRNIVYLSDVKNAVFDNLCFMYTGSHALGGPAHNTLIQNCVFEWIGGSQFCSGGRYGNAVEFWATTDNVAVKNCYINEVYDAGLTFQFKGDHAEDIIIDGVDFSGNLIERCAYCIEYFSRQYNSNGDFLRNITMKDNILRRTGEGFCVGAPDAHGRDACIKGWDTKNQSENFVIENNVFDRAVSQLLHIGSYAWDVAEQKLGAPTPEYMPTMKNNTYVCNDGGIIARWNGEAVTANKDSAKMLAAVGCEKDAKIYIVSKN